VGVAAAPLRAMEEERERVGGALKADWTRQHGVGGRQRRTGRGAGAGTTGSGIEHARPSELSEPLTRGPRSPFEF
jgi:hypothetical protein